MTDKIVTACVDDGTKKEGAKLPAEEKAYHAGRDVAMGMAVGAAKVVGYFLLACAVGLGGLMVARGWKAYSAGARQAADPRVDCRYSRDLQTESPVPEKPFAERIGEIKEGGWVGGPSPHDFQYRH